MSELVEVVIEAGVATVTLNRPEKRNAMNDALRTAVVEALERINSDDKVRALVLTGGGKSFCGGGDVDAMQQRLQMPASEVGFKGWSRQQAVHHAQALLHNLPIPTIAAVNGAAIGLGADVALACDFIVASSAASFSWSYIARGLVADGGGMYFLPRRVGLSRAKELIFTGRTVDPEDALRLGIADRLSAPDALLEDARAWARQLSQGSRAALALGKSILNKSFELSAEEVFSQGSVAQGLCYASTEHRESVATFLAKSADRGDASRKP